MQLLFKMESKAELGKCLDPQPSPFVDCIEDCQNHGVFHFFEGNEMEGHKCVMTITSPNLEMEPRFDWDRKHWFWSKLSSNTLYQREWWKTHF